VLPQFVMAGVMRAFDGSILDRAVLVSWLGELLIAKSVITRDEAAAVVQAAGGSASVNVTTYSSGALLAAEEIGPR
jgi:hypothetical protein